jgi:hypothetical protein
MSFAVSQFSTDAREMMELPTALAKWYAVHSSIRRLWAIEDRDALIVFVSLEPTSDGDDALPVWLARNEDWASDLASLTRREVQVRLIASGVFDRSYVGTDAITIAELSWRDSWIG